MKKTIIALMLAALPMAGYADDVVTTNSSGVTVTSFGSDVRAIVHLMFTQAGKSYVLNPTPFKPVNLNLNNVPFEEALKIACKVGQLKYEIQNGIYFFSPDTTPAVTVDNVSTLTKVPEPVKGKLDHAVLNKKLTTKLTKTDIREVFAEFSKQTGIAIEVTESVPAYKVDAILIDTSLRYSLDAITKAAGLKYRFSERMSIEIYKPEKSK
jgi:hypothetical protein